MKNIILFLFVSISVFAQKSELKNGDLLFINIDCGPMCNAINAVTTGYNNNDFNHMGLVATTNNIDFFVYEAIGEAVVKTPLKAFLKYTKKPVYVGTLKPKYTQLIPKAIAFCESNLGVPYDDDFLYNNGKYYCSELVYDAFKFAYKNKAFFKLFPMTYKEPNSNQFFPVWVDHFKKQNIAIPQGKPGCNPGGMSLDKKIVIKKLQL